MLKKLYNRFWHLPSGDELGWDNYWDKVKKAYPTKYFLRCFLPNSFKDIRHLCVRFMYFLKCMTLPSHKYHIVDLRRPGPKHWDYYTYGYLEPFDRIYLSCFVVLKNFVEKEKPENPRDHFSEEEIEDSEHLQLELKNYQEMMELYHWWMVERDIKLDEIDVKFNELASAEKGTIQKELREAWVKLSDEFDKTEEEQIYRLVKIRRFLWK